jgi:hypothetical protein
MLIYGIIITEYYPKKGREMIKPPNSPVLLFARSTNGGKSFIVRDVRHFLELNPEEFRFFKSVLYKKCSQWDALWYLITRGGRDE